MVVLNEDWGYVVNLLVLVMGKSFVKIVVLFIDKMELVINDLIMFYYLLYLYIEINFNYIFDFYFGYILFVFVI